MTELIPIEVIQLIKDKPEITYLMLKMTTSYFLTSTKPEKQYEDVDIDNVIWQFLQTYEAGEMLPQEVN